MTTSYEDQIRNVAHVAAAREWLRHHQITSTRALVGTTVRQIWRCTCETVWQGDGEGFPTREQATQWREEHRAAEVESASERAIRDVTGPRDIADRVAAAALPAIAPSTGGGDTLRTAPSAAGQHTDREAIEAALDRIGGLDPDELAGTLGAHLNLCGDEEYMFKEGVLAGLREALKAIPAEES